MNFMDRISVIRQSLRAFVCGIVGLVPVIGFFPAVYALLLWQRVRGTCGREWNPAAVYLKWGFVSALIGLLNTVATVLVVGLTLIARDGDAAFFCPADI